MSFLHSVIADATPPRIMRKSAASPAHPSAGNLLGRVTHSAHSAEKNGRVQEYHRTPPSVVSERKTMRRRGVSSEQQVEKQTSSTNEPEPKIAVTPPDLKQRQKSITPSRTTNNEPPSPENPLQSSRFQGGRTRQTGESDEQQFAHTKHPRRPTTNQTLTKRELTSQQNDKSLPGPSHSMDSPAFDSARLWSQQFLDEQEMGDKAGSLKPKAGADHVEISPVKPAAMGNDRISAETVPLPTPHNEPQTTAVLHTKPISLEEGETETSLREDRESFSIAQPLHPEEPTRVDAQHSDSQRSEFPDQQKIEPGDPFNVAEKTYPEHDGSFHERVGQEEGGALFQQPLLWPTPPQQDTPRVQIGQVDVIIEAPHAPETRSVPAPENDFASRHFLRRL